MALLGEMHYIPLGPTSWMSLPRENGLAYAAQESWVQNETIRVRTVPFGTYAYQTLIFRMECQENILFGAPMDEERYNKGELSVWFCRDEH